MLLQPVCARRCTLPSKLRGQLPLGRREPALKHERIDIPLRYCDLFGSATLQLAVRIVAAAKSKASAHIACCAVSGGFGLAATISALIHPGIATKPLNLFLLSGLEANSSP